MNTKEPRAVFPGTITRDTQMGEWEIVAEGTSRLKVTGGWIFQVFGPLESSPPAICFVPDMRK